MKNKQITLKLLREEKSFGHQWSRFSDLGTLAELEVISEGGEGKGMTSLKRSVL